MIVLKWSRFQLQKFKNKGIELNEVADFQSLKERDPQIRSISPILVKGTADISSNKVTFHLHITGELILPSSRTLRDVQFPIDIVSTETFLFEGYTDETNLDVEQHLTNGDVVDLTPVIEELILLEIPMQVYSEEDENIPTTLKVGKDWEYIQDEEHLQKQKIDPRLAELAKLLKNSEE